MTTIALDPSRSLVGADLLKLRKRRGLVVISALLTVISTLTAFTIMELLHVATPKTHGPAGGISNLGHGAFLVSMFGAIAAMIVAATIGTGDLESGVYRDLVATGRSRLQLYAARFAGGLLFVLPYTIAAYALTALASVVLAGGLPAPSTHLLIAAGLWTFAGVVFYYLLGLGLACLVGSRSYTIGVALAWMLALTPLLTSITSFGVGRELIPGADLQHLTPAALGDSARQGGSVPMSVTAAVIVLTLWALAAIAAGAWRDITREA